MSIKRLYERTTLIWSRRYSTKTMLAIIIFLNVAGCLFAQYADAQTRASRSGRKQATSLPVAKPTPIPTVITKENAREILSWQTTCFSSPYNLAVTNFKDGKQMSGNTEEMRKKYLSLAYIENKGWIKIEDRHYPPYGHYDTLLTFTPEGEKFFFGSTPPSWAKVRLPTSEDVDKGDHRKSVTLILAKREPVEVTNITEQLDAYMNKIYWVEVRWMWHPTEVGAGFVAPGPHLITFPLRYDHGKWNIPASFDPLPTVCRPDKFPERPF